MACAAIGFGVLKSKDVMLLPFRSLIGLANSYRRPTLTVSFGFTFQSSWMNAAQYCVLFEVCAFNLSFVPSAIPNSMDARDWPIGELESELDGPFVYVPLLLMNSFEFVRSAWLAWYSLQSTPN